MENILNQLGQTIKKARLASKLTQDELAEHTEKTKEHLTRMIEMCNEHDLKIITATVKTMLETN